jgi:hypothetical protein
MATEVDTQKEIGEGENERYLMEERLLALKNVYAENNHQKRDRAHSYSSYTLGFSLDSHKKIVVSPEQRYHMIAKEAYYRAKQHNFQGASLAQDWIEAEAEIDKILKGNEQDAPVPRPDRTLYGHE